jgi:hypothetical protein
MQVTAELLLEMNEDVKGTWRAEEPAALIASEPDFFAQFTVVIATQMPVHVVAPLAALLYAKQIPLMVRTMPSAPGVVMHGCCCHVAHCSWCGRTAWWATFGWQCPNIESSSRNLTLQLRTSASRYELNTPLLLLGHHPRLLSAEPLPRAASLRGCHRLGRM